MSALALATTVIPRWKTELSFTTISRHIPPRFLFLKLHTLPLPPTCFFTLSLRMHFRLSLSRFQFFPPLPSHDFGL